MNDFIQHTNELLGALIPGAIGFGIGALLCKLATKSDRINRPLLGIGSIIIALGVGATSAMLLIDTGKFSPILDICVMTAFFTGLALFLPAPANAAETGEAYGRGGIILMISGIALGLCHALALMFTTWWPERLLEIYAAIGIG